MGARSVTPLLTVGDFGATGREHVEVFDAGTAAMLVLQGVVVVVPDDDVAANVLRALGQPEDLIKERLQFSHTGQVGEPI